MDSSLTNSNRFLARAYLVLAPLALALVMTLPSHATTTTAVDDLAVETAKVTGIYDDVVPAAIGSTVFGIGAILVKRIAFS